MCKLTDSAGSILPVIHQRCSFLLHCFWFFSFSFWFFLRVPISPITLPICSCTVSLFSLELLKFSSWLFYTLRRPKICVLSRSHSNICFVSSNFFSCVLVCFVIFCFNSERKYWIIGTKVNRPAVWGFMLFWVGVELCLMFSVARAFKFL